nr:esterase [Quercus suber]
MAFMDELTDAERGEMQRSSINITKHRDRSLYMCLLQHLLLHISGRLLGFSEKDHYPPGSPQLDPHKKAKKRCHIHERQVEGMWLYDVVAKGRDPEKKYNKRMYYFAGGGWHSPASADHWAFVAELAVKIPDLAISLVSYPLAPNSPAPKAYPMLRIMYDALLKEAEKSGEGIIMAGDSAGGNIAISLTLDALARNPSSHAPIALLVISPSTDLSRLNPEIKKVATHDPLLKKSFINQTAAQWRGEWDAKDPRVSPLFGDVSLFAQRGVKIHGVVGGYDMLGPDAVLFRDKLAKAGVEGEWLDWDKQIHVFPLTWPYHLREGEQSKDWIIDVLTKT